jgi:methyl-accepting chemotaxis protein
LDSSLTHKQVLILRQSWEKLRPGSRRLTQALYERLFVQLPQVRHLFAEDMHEQSCKLAAVINFVMGKLHRLEDIFPDLRDIGKKHSAYAIPIEWYDAVGNSLVAEIKLSLTEDWDAELEEAWTALFQVLKRWVWDGQHARD